MSASRLSLVMGSSRPSQENEAISLPLPETGTIHVHLHFGEGDAVHTAASPPRRSGWGAVIAGVAVVAAAVGGYQIGHRSRTRRCPQPPPCPAAERLRAGGGRLSGHRTSACHAAGHPCASPGRPGTNHRSPARSYGWSRVCCPQPADPFGPFPFHRAQPNP